ncbi:bifunctional phosphopantothenoylcysteine decarboxylase/phosphopantothenate--cysteine ligase CoaBC [Candidatus Albibeggiatoa sp. nov. NOAA]|uniref:bifunctional phosphopantothenoylcysteine decarboxylase/phosphopantothenate--cysteine ligase CoaBC n=1 Tax=Candidatus Albibeggiatoa sp. nov. NOAA TaxID=3162724 RepID=UPI0032F4E3D5|nr:bifunctional phosphopantothenoylcysteine decarboxylase/phosphopantothenate--cysteine ligase CoaBC [Thiotrichaceae bacterium]
MYLKDKKILIGITGSIAAYKIADLVRRLTEQQAQVRVVMTQAAMQFITPLTMQAVSGHKVYTDLLDAEAEAAMGHIELARWADIVLIAPASADFMARLTHGLADDLLSTLCLATTAPIAIAPAMNQQMWKAPATQANCQTLQQRGVHFFGPASGLQACGEDGLGRMLEPFDIIDCLHQHFTSQILAGKHIVITAGPTREDIDPVRFISNRSSGKMGYAIAKAAQLSGANVTLVSGQTCLSKPPKVNTIDVYSAQDMYESVMQYIEQADIFIATAAVADYQPKQQATQKIKKTQEAMSIELSKTTDILASVGHMQNKPFVVGFAAETNNVEAYAKDKMVRKNLDMIAANLVGVENAGFESDHNALTVYWPDGQQVLPHCTKTELAHHLIKVIAQRYEQSK